MRADLTYCDFLVLAPLRLEIEALVSALRKTNWNIEHVEGSEFRSEIRATIEDSAVRRHAVIIQLTRQGVLNASVDTARVLELYDPGYVVSFGIAGTFDTDDAPIGAVVFATLLVYYEPSKDKSEGTKSRVDTVATGESLLVLFDNLTLDGIIKIDGPFASGEKLIADIGSKNRERIIDDFGDKILGVEMEAAGVGRAVHGLCPSAEFVVIKGISDRADADKKNISVPEQKKNRHIAASNAALCLTRLMQKAPLRRFQRSWPKPGEDDVHEKAISEATQISEALAPFDITVNFAQLNACLDGRRGRIPVYFHWRQHSKALHWIDFKLLTAIKAMPQDVIVPVPLVTIEGKGIRESQLWYKSVYQILGVYPTTDAQIKKQLAEISKYIHRVGLTIGAEQDIRSVLERLTGRPEILLNLMRYMLGQFCHRRLFVFVWKSSREKWELLSRAFGIWFAMFEWETIQLEGKPGKQEAPGEDLLIEPPSYASLKHWLSTSPSPDVINEFLDQFNCHLDSYYLTSSDEPHHANKSLNALMDYWNKVFFGQT